MNLQFGSGVLFGIPNAGNTATNPTPTKFGVLQEVSVEFKGDLKKLYGQKQFPVAKARGKLDVTLKGKMAVLDVDSLNQLYFGQVAATGVQRPSGDESHATASSITPTHAVAGSAITILSVQNGSTGATMTLVPSSPAVGQFSFTQAVSGGSPTSASLTFNASETAVSIIINYLYADSTTGKTLTLTNQLMGFAPEFQAFLYDNFRGKYFGLQLNSCVMGSLSIPSKQEDFWILDFDADASADATDTLGYIYADLA